MSRQSFVMCVALVCLISAARAYSYQVQNELDPAAGAAVKLKGLIKQLEQLKNVGEELDKVHLLFRDLEELKVSKELQSVADQKLLYQLRNDLQRDVIETCANQLVQLLDYCRLINATEALDFQQQLVAKLNPYLVRTIYAKVIDDLQFLYPAVELTNFIYEIYRKNDLYTYELMLNIQLDLFFRRQNAHYIDNDYYANVAYHFYRAQRDNAYFGLSDVCKRRLETAIASLDDQLRFLYSDADASWCLLNRNYNEYLYVSDLNIDDTMLAYLWHRKNEISRSVYFSHEIVRVDKLPLDNKVELEIWLWNNYHKKWLHIDRASGHAVGGDKSIGLKVKYIDGYLTFSDDDRLLCAGYKSDNHRRYTVGLNATEHEYENHNCHWLASKNCHSE